MQETHSDWMVPPGIGNMTSLPKSQINYLWGISNKILKSSDDCAHSGIMEY